MYSLYVHSEILNDKPLLWCVPSNSLGIGVVIVNKTDKAPVLMELTFWRWARNKQIHGLSKWESTKKKIKQKIGVMLFRGMEAAI